MDSEVASWTDKLLSGLPHLGAELRVEGVLNAKSSTCLVGWLPHPQCSPKGVEQRSLGGTGTQPILAPGSPSQPRFFLKDHF